MLGCFWRGEEEVNPGRRSGWWTVLGLYNQNKGLSTLQHLLQISVLLEASHRPLSGLSHLSVPRSSCQRDCSRLVVFICSEGSTL